MLCLRFFFLIQLQELKRRGKPALNSKGTVWITDDKVLEELKLKEFEKAEAEKEKEAKKLERVQKRKEREEKQLATEQGKRERADKQLQKRKERAEEKQLVKDQRAKEAVKKSTQETVSKKKSGKEKASSPVHVHLQVEMHAISSDDNSSDAEDTICPKCGFVHVDADSQELRVIVFTCTCNIATQCLNR